MEHSALTQLLTDAIKPSFCIMIISGITAKSAFAEKAIKQNPNFGQEDSSW